MLHEHGITSVASQANSYSLEVDLRSGSCIVPLVLNLLQKQSSDT